MSYLRNLYHEYIKINFKTFDYVGVLDMDLKGVLYEDGIFHSVQMMEKDRQIDAVACNGMLWEDSIQQYQYYDSFAHIDVGEPYIFETGKDKQLHDVYVHNSVSHRYRYYEEPREVMSAFGGFCLYRRGSFFHSRYNYSPTFFSCEHAFFHAKMTKLYVNPRNVFLILENNS
jgi:hypothetical protein